MAANGAGAAAAVDSARLRALGRGALALAAACALFAAYVLYAAFPGRGDGRPIRGGAGRVLNALVPQGWAFFTADPSAVAYVAYRQTPDGWTPTTGPLASVAYGWGFDRAPRLQDQQIQSVAAGIDRRYWRPCPRGLGLADVGSCLATDTVGAYADNPWPSPVLCGRLAIVAARPVGWADTRAGGPVLEPASVLNVDLRCP